MAAQPRPKSTCFGLSLFAALVFIVFYPLTMAPIGEITNGGALGLIVLSIACLSSWLAFAFNTSHAPTRIFVQLPLTAFITFLLVRELVIQHRAGHIFWF